MNYNQRLIESAGIEDQQMNESSTSCFEIHSDTRRALITAIGAELQSIRAKGSDEEFMWQGDPAVWSGRAPILFPVVGRLADSTLQHDGRRFDMPQHGFVRKTAFAAVPVSDNEISFELAASETSLEHYPWKFMLRVTFKLEGNVLQIAYSIENRDESTLYFNIGSHPAFRLPCDPEDNAAVNHEDYFIHFNSSESLETYQIVDGLLQKPPRSFPLQDNRIQLTRSLFDDDALVFMDINSTEVSLCHRKTGNRVVVGTGGAPHLGIWSKPAAEYVCIEPWWGYADFSDVAAGKSSAEIMDKPSIQMLPPGGSFETSISIATHEA